MSIATLAHGARQSLARGLEALQARDAPAGLLEVAQPVARAMGVFVELERSPDGIPSARIRQVLDSLREGLRLLQLPEHVEHPAAARSTAAVAETLAAVVELVLFLDRAREPLDLTPAWPGTMLAQPATVKAPVKAQPEAASAAIPEPPAGPRQPPIQTLAPVAARAEPRGVVLPIEPAQAAPDPARASSPAARPMPRAAAALRPKLEVPVSTRTVETSATTAVAPTSTHLATTPDRAAPAPGMTVSVAPQLDALAQANAGAQLNALLRRDVIIERGLRAIDVALGTHSASNFYMGLTDGDVVGAGGLFVGTYQVPKVGEKVLLEISMPGGYQFVAKAIVAWTRGVAHASASLDSLRAPASAPGFGAQFCEVTDEGRRLIQRYVRNREPLFYDAL